MKFKEMIPLVVYDNECFICVQFAKLVNFMARGRVSLVGHYTDLGKQIRESVLDSSALEMFWFIDEKIAYGGRAAIVPLLSAILRSRKNKMNQRLFEVSDTVGCKSLNAVFFRSTSVFTHSKRLVIQDK